MMADRVLYDAHVHLGFFADAEEVAQAAATDGVVLFANTVTPAEFDQLAVKFAASENVRVGVGLHPWWIKRAQASDVLERLDSTTYVGEVGLDFGKRGTGTEDVQTEAFRAIARRCGELGGKVLSLHAISAADTLLDILEEEGALSNCTCILHWFSGTSNDLARARKAGCYFSVNPMMARSRRGREYVRQLPPKYLLLETDAPPGEHIAFPYPKLHGMLDEAADAIAQIKGEESLEKIAKNARSVFSN